MVQYHLGVQMLCMHMIIVSVLVYCPLLPNDQGYLVCSTSSNSMPGQISSPFVRKFMVAPTAETSVENY